MLTHPRAKNQVDLVVVILIVLFFIGLIFIVATGWVVCARQAGTASNRLDAAGLPATPPPRCETPQAEVARLYVELERAQRSLATVSAQATGAALTHSPSTVLDKPPLALVLDAPLYKQEHSLSCESSSAAMAARFFGASVSEAQILDALPRDENPHKGFRGNVDGVYGGLDDYGVYAGPIRRILTGLGLTATPFAGAMADIREHLRHGRVLIAWVTYDLQVQTPRQMTFGDGETATLVPYEHAFLIVGYNGEGFWVNDPYTGTARFYAEREFARSFAYLGNMALVVGPGK